VSCDGTREPKSRRRSARLRVEHHQKHFPPLLSFTRRGRPIRSVPWSCALSQFHSLRLRSSPSSAFVWRLHRIRGSDPRAALGVSVGRGAGIRAYILGCATKEAMADTPVVYVVDDDGRVRSSLGRLIRSAGLSVQTFASAQAFLHARQKPLAGCIVLDIGLPGLSELDLQSELARVEIHMPNRVHYRTRRHPDVGPRHEGGGGRVPHQAVS
jgi:hypothetical protein